MLEGITSGKVKMPYLLLIYGVESIGKTTFAASFPDPVFLGPEAGSYNLNVKRFSNIKTFEDLLKDMDQLLTKPHDIKTAVFDSLDWIEPLLYESIKKRYSVNEIEDAGGGFGKWVNVVLSEWRKKFISRIIEMREKKGMNVVLIAHYQLKSFNDPQSKDPYDRYSIKLQEKASAMFRELVDAVLFFNYETHVKKDKGMSKAKAISDGTRYIYTTKTAAYDAKNRFGLPERMEFPLNGAFDHLEQTINQSDTPDQSDNLKKEIWDLMVDLPDNTIVEKVTKNIEKAGNDFAALTAIKNRLTTIINEGK